MGRFGVLCTVSGGVTGTRTSWLRQGEKLETFADLASAEERAAALSRQMNHQNARASFRYVAREF